MSIARFGSSVRGFSTCLAHQGSNRYARITTKMGKTGFSPSRGIQPVGLTINGKFQIYKEMIPELVVPDLTDFPLKPYVSLRCPENTEEPVTARAIFDTCLAPKVEAQFKEGASAPEDDRTEASGER